MEQEYSVSKGWKIFTYVFSIAFIGAMLIGLIYALINGKDILVFAGLLSIHAIVFGYYSLAAYRTKTILKNDEIIQRWAFKKKRLLFKEIKGIRITNKNIVIESKDPNSPKIVISDYSYIKDSVKLISFLRSKFLDLDREEYEDELIDILYDPQIGVSTNDREYKLIKGKKVARILNVLGIAIGLWLLVYPYPYSLSIYAGLIYPLIVLVFFFKDQEVFTLLEQQKKRAYPSLGTALVVPSLVLLIRVMLDFDLLYFKDCLMPVVVAFVVLALIFALFIKMGKNKISNLGMTISFAAIYSFSGIVTVNCEFDKSVPTGFKAQVLDQHIEMSKTITYYLRLSAWNSKDAGEDESVTYSLYHQVNKGDMVTVYVKKGYLHIPWYFIDK